MTDTSLVAGVESTRQAWMGIGLADSVQGLTEAIGSDGWVDDVLAGVGLGLEVASTVLDPFSALLSSAVAWAMEYFEPLRQILDALAGMPGGFLKTLLSEFDVMIVDVTVCGDLGEFV